MPFRYGNKAEAFGAKTTLKASKMVPPTGLEPVRETPADFKSAVSTCSTTAAWEERNAVNVPFSGESVKQKHEVFPCVRRADMIG